MRIERERVRPTRRRAEERWSPSEADVRSAGWRSRDILRALALGIALYYGLRLVWTVSSILLIGFLGVLFGLALSAAVDRLERLRVPRVVGAAGIVLGLYGLLFGLGAWTMPTLRSQAADLRERLPEAVDRAESWLAARSDGPLGLLIGQAVPEGQPDEPPAGAGPSPDTGATDTTGAADVGAARAGAAARDVTAGTRPAADESTVSLGEAFSGWLGGATQYVRPLLTGTVAAVTGLLLVTFVAIYLAVEPRTYRDGLLLLVPRRGRDRAREVLAATGVTLRRWLVAQLIAMVVIGVVTTAALLVLGVPGAFALGLLAGLLEFVPIVGPIVAAAPAIALGFLDSPERVLWIAGAYVAIQQLESNVLQPVLMREGLKLPPILTLAAQGMLALVFGFLGILVAVPLLAAVVVPIKMLYVQDVIGEDVHVFGTDDDGREDDDEDEDADEDADEDDHGDAGESQDGRADVGDGPDGSRAGR